VAESYKEKNVVMGIILGTGNNACYREDVKSILPEHRKGYDKEYMIINIEWGQFPKVPRTKYDKKLDKLTPNPGHQYLEKMVSGMYLGEICRLVMMEMIKKGELLKKEDAKIFEKEYAMVSADVSDIENDKTKNLLKAEQILIKIGVKEQTQRDRRIIKKIAELISDRAGNVVAMGIASVIQKIDPKLIKKHTVAIDGSVYEKYYNFPKKIRQGLKVLLGIKEKKIKLVLSKDGSGKGAAIISASV
jgi:hexokinase